MAGIEDEVDPMKEGICYQVCTWEQRAQRLYLGNRMGCFWGQQKGKRAAVLDLGPSKTSVLRGECQKSCSFVEQTVWDLS